MLKKRANILIIAGYDPSAGAGLLADVKTAENHAVYAHAVCTAITFQNSTTIESVKWLSLDEIIHQIKLCFEEELFEFAKIGITQTVEMLQCIIKELKTVNPHIKIIWDPVFKASSGTGFMQDCKAEDLEALLPNLFLTTPNLGEFRFLYPDAIIGETCLRLSKKCGIYLKGGHDMDFPGRDFLYAKAKQYMLKPKVKRVFQKHGSGCVFATSLTCNLAKGYPLLKASLLSKKYIEQFLNSNSSLLGWHK